MKKIIIALILAIFSLNSANASNLSCSNKLNNIYGNKINIKVKNRIIKLLPKIDKKYSDIQIYKLNNKIISILNRNNKIKNNEKKLSLYIYILTELDKIIHNKDIIKSEYIKKECAFIKKENIKEEIKENNNISFDKIVFNKGIYNYTNGTLTIKNNIYSDSRYNKLLKTWKERGAYPLITNIDIKEELIDNTIIDKNFDIKTKISSKKEQYINGVKYILNKNPLLIKYNKADLINHYNNYVEKDKDGLIVEYKNIETIGTIEKDNNVEGTIYGDNAYNFINKLINTTNTYKKYQLRPIITSDLIEKDNNIDYIKNIKGNNEPIDYYYSIDNTNYNVDKYNIILNNYITGKKTDMLNGYRMWEFFNNDLSLEEKKETLKNIFVPVLNGRTDLRIYKYYENTNGIRLYGPNNIKYNVGLTKNEYNNLDNYNIKLKSNIKRLNAIKFQKENTGYIDNSNINTLLNSVKKINKITDNREKIDNEILLLEKENKDLENIKGELYLKWFDRKNICLFHSKYFDKDSLTFIYPDQSKQFSFDVYSDRKRTLVNSGKYDSILCKF